MAELEEAWAALDTAVWAERRFDATPERDPNYGYVLADIEEEQAAARAAMLAVLDSVRDEFDAGVEHLTDVRHKPEREDPDDIWAAYGDSCCLYHVVAQRIAALGTAGAEEEEEGKR